ncbi:MAG: heavy metal translocating P-type ATPase metal-binding domain-containing protein [Bacteroidia bacterium]|nr:heavy metal translocating P-type ATPase metal-binding domain-containing protein [Bacteroidia bacterium]
MIATLNPIKTKCEHCGQECNQDVVVSGEKYFCCEGCKSVYQILNENGLCEYYNLNETPGATRKVTVRPDKFAYLEEEQVGRALIHFRDDVQTHVTFYLPQIHCSSCLWLLEHINVLNAGILSSEVNFPQKEITLIFNHHKTSLRKVAEILTEIGYEPYISLQNLQSEKRKSYDKSRIYKLGVAGFCLGNIMLMSFPEYFSMDGYIETNLAGFFRYLNLALSLPTFFYSGSEFFIAAYKGLKNRFLNIDAPIALALIITFVRSVYEVVSGTGSGYFDSLSGIIFFMLIGRILQDRTYQAISFDRDYTSYFPIAVTKLLDKKESAVTLPEIKTGDILLIHDGELIPSDGILSKGEARIDYSFITGESLPVHKEKGEIVYAGGKQIGGNIELLVTREVAQSYLTDLWNKQQFKKFEDKHSSFVHIVSQYFTVVLLGITVLTAAYWYRVNPSLIMPSVTSILIVACPCALLLSSSFTYGNILRMLSRNGFYLRSAAVLEGIIQADTIVFDKTGTLTVTEDNEVTYTGQALSDAEQNSVALLVSQSQHPLSKAVKRHLNRITEGNVSGFQAITGKGLAGESGNLFVKAGSYEFVTGVTEKNKTAVTAEVHLSVDGKYKGYFSVHNRFRTGTEQLIKTLKKYFSIAVISGDNDFEEKNLQARFGEDSEYLFYQKPEDKLNYVRMLQAKGRKVMMIGDGLNDAGALKQSEVGISVSEKVNNFTPASDAVLEAQSLSRLFEIIRFARSGKEIIIISFIISLIYNIAGLYFAVQGTLSPLIAAILMPASSVTIVLITYGLSGLSGWRLGFLNEKNDSKHDYNHVLT